MNWVALSVFVAALFAIWRQDREEKRLRAELNRLSSYLIYYTQTDNQPTIANLLQLIEAAKPAASSTGIILKEMFEEWHVRESSKGKRL